MCCEDLRISRAKYINSVSEGVADNATITSLAQNVYRTGILIGVDDPMAVSSFGTQNAVEMRVFRAGNVPSGNPILVRNFWSGLDIDISQIGYDITQALDFIFISAGATMGVFITEVCIRPDMCEE